MSGERDVGAPLEDMIDACERIILFTAGLTDSEVSSENSPVWGSVLHHLAVTGEAAKRVPPAVQRRRPKVDWRRIAGMRDKVIHCYFGIERRIVIDTIRVAIPAVLPQLRSLLQELDAE